MVQQSIPASEIVKVNPGVIAAGGTGLVLSGLLLTTSTRIPIGAVQTFFSANAVGAVFGLNSVEFAKAQVYFSGFDNSNVKPAQLLMAQYPLSAPVGAYVWGASVANLNLAALQALSGTLIVTVDGVTQTSANINLSAATSFSNAAALMQAGLGASDCQFTGSIAAGVLTVSAVAAGALFVGQIIAGAGVTPGTQITALGTGTGGTGTYTVSPSQTVAGPLSMTAGNVTVAYDAITNAFVIYAGSVGPSSTISAVTGTLATNVGLSANAGAQTSQGSAIATPNAFMTALAQFTQNWAGFSTVFMPDTNTAVAFAAWTSQQNNRFYYVAWSNDASVTTQVNPGGAIGTIVNAANDSGTVLLYEPVDGFISDFILGAVASIDFTQENGRSTLALKSQAGLTAQVTNQQVARNLLANGYNFYGAYGTANEVFTFLNNGSITGAFDWLDTFIDQVQLNNAIQLALMLLLVQAKSIPYNARGRALIDAACLDPIKAGLNFGSIQPGVTLSNAQAAEIDAAAGISISQTISTRGWYLQIKDAAPAVRQARGTPPITFWYADGESVQSISVASLTIL